MPSGLNLIRKLIRKALGRDGAAVQTLDQFPESLPGIIEDFFDYTKLSRATFEKFCQVGTAGKEWNSLGLNNRDANDCFYFYLTSAVYFLATSRLQFSRGRRRLPVYEEHGRGSILDFGAGIGGEAFELAAQGRQVTYYELCAVSRDFMRYRSARRGVPITILDWWDFDGHSQKFDTIFCFDVFDHIPTWRDLLPAFKRQLAPGGVLVHKTEFGHDSGHCPYHFPDSEAELNRLFDQHGIKAVAL